MSYAKHEIDGWVAKDAIIRITKTGKTIAQFSLCVSFGSDDKKSYHYYDIEAWEYQGEILKGMRFKVSGHIKQERFEDRAGNNRSKIVFVAKTIEKIEKKMGVESMGTVVNDAPDFNDSHIPF